MYRCYTDIMPNYWGGGGGPLSLFPVPTAMSKDRYIIMVIKYLEWYCHYCDIR